MAAYLRPRRGTPIDSTVVLKEGEFFLDTTNSNNTSNSWGRIYVGDNSTQLKNLKPFIDYPENMIIHSGISSTGTDSNISNGNTLSTIISAIKNVLSTKSSAIKISETDYGNLSTSEKNDPNKVYFRYEGNNAWLDYLPISGGTMTGALISPGINMTGDISMNSGTNINVANGNINITTGNIVTPGNDSYGIRPAINNYGQIGSSSYYYYRGYINYIYCQNVYGQLSSASSGATGDYQSITYKYETIGGYKHIYVYGLTNSITVTTGPYGNAWYRSMNIPISSSTGWSSSGKVLSMYPVSAPGTGLQFCTVTGWTDTQVTFYLTCMTSESTAKVYGIYAHLVIES